MRTAALTLISFVAFGYAMKAQKFSLLPQVGFENSKTKINYNDLSSFSPAGVVFTPQVGLQFIYRSKPGHGFFLGAASSRSVVPFKFTNPENGMNDYTINTGKMQVRVEGGYQFSSKPIYFKKTANAPTATKAVENKSTTKKSCGSYSYKSYCQKNKTADKRPASDIDKTKQKVSNNNKGSWVRLQPNAGMGFIPAVKPDVITKVESGQTTHQYRAGNWQTALLAGMGFELGRNNTRQLSVTVNYFKGIGNLNTQTISTVTGTKTITTRLDSEVSGWNVRIGVPFTLGAKKPAIKPQPQKKTQEVKKNCEYKIRYRCSKII